MNNAGNPVTEYRSKKRIPAVVIMLVCFSLGTLFAILSVVSGIKQAGMNRELAAKREEQAGITAPTGNGGDAPKWDQEMTNEMGRWFDWFEESKLEMTAESQGRKTMNYIIAAVVLFASGAIGSGIMFTLAKRTERAVRLRNEQAATG